MPLQANTKTWSWTPGVPATLPHGHTLALSCPVATLGPKPHPQHRQGAGVRPRCGGALLPGQSSFLHGPLLLLSTLSPRGHPHLPQPSGAPGLKNSLETMGPP